MAKTSKTSVKTVKKAVKPVKSKGAAAQKSAAKMKNKVTQAASKAMQPVRKVTQAASKVTRAGRKVTQAGRKVTQPLRKATQALRKPAQVLRNVNQVEVELAEEPHARFRPVYLGRPFVLSTNVPPYMPRNEADLMDWIKNYLDVAKTYVDTFPDVFGESAPYPRQNVANLRANMATARSAAREAEELARAWRAFVRIGIFATEHELDDPLTNPTITVNLTTPYSWSLVGLVGMIDEQVRALRVHENFNQTVAEHLGIIPRAPSNVDPNTLTPVIRTRNIGGQRVRLTFRSPAGIRGVWGARIMVDRGDGVLHFLSNVNVGNFEDVHIQPERAATWTYYVQYVDAAQMGIGAQASASVTVQAPRM